MARKLSAGPTPDGGFISRRTDNDYLWAVAVIDRSEIVYRPKKAEADGRDGHPLGYIANPDLGKWVGFSWHRSRNLASKSLIKAQNLGCKGAIVIPVVEEQA